MHRLADQPLERRDIRLLAVEVGRHRIVVEFDGGLDELVAYSLACSARSAGISTS